MVPIVYTQPLKIHRSNADYFSLGIVGGGYVLGAALLFRV
jgi:hypothetical protein